MFHLKKPGLDSGPDCLIVSRIARPRYRVSGRWPVQGYLAHKKHPTSLGPPYDPRHSPTVGSYEGAVSYERGTPVVRALIDSSLSTTFTHKVDGVVPHTRRNSSSNSSNLNLSQSVELPFKSTFNFWHTTPECWKGLVHLKEIVQNVHS